MAEEHKTVIKVTGDVKSAVTGLAKVRNAANLVRASVTGIFTGFGMVSFAVAAIDALTSAYKKLDEWISRAAISASKNYWRKVLDSAADAISNLTSRQRTLNRVLKEELDALAKSAELRNLQQSGEEYVAGNRKGLDRAREIAGVTDEREKLVIEQRWKEEDERAASDAKISSVENQIKDEDEKSSIYGSKASFAKESAEKAKAEIEDLYAELIRANTDEKKKEITDAVAALREKQKTAEEDAKRFSAEADMATKRMEILDGEKKRLEELRDATANGSMNFDALKANLDRIAELKERIGESESGGEPETERIEVSKRQIAELEEENRKLMSVMTKAQIENAEALAEYDRKRKEEAAAAAEERQRKVREADDNAREFRESAEDDEDRRHRDKANEYGDYADKLVDVSSHSGNRLTAMGLGDGSTGSLIGSISADVHRLVSLFTQNIEATRSLRLGAGGAVYGD